jgi:diguanylate cyclase (GGDEF)-like protein/PAS domain S-box-containing protein
MTFSLIDHPTRNRILAALPADEFAHLLDDLELVSVELGQVLYEPGDCLRHVYFPTNCIVSLVFTTESGASAELAIAGNDGLVGTQLILGGDTTNHRAVVQSAGKAYRVSADVIRWELHQDGVLQQLALRYTQALMTQMAQSIVCNRHHTVDQQLCRWLLLSLDRLPGDELNMTQELIANMLGVRREAVTEAAGKLQAAGLIRYRRGHITVTDRPGLEARVCECYKVVKQELDRLFLAHPVLLPVPPRTRPSPATLRQRAEARLQQTEAALLPAVPKDADHLVHELQVHQIELEMHNEELRLAYEEADALRTRYADIYDFAPVGYVTIDAQGTILDLNLVGAILLGIKRSQKGRERFAASVMPDDLPTFNHFLETALSAKNKVVCEIMLLPSGQRPECMVRIEAVHDEAEQECRMVIIDISVEKQAEKASLERAQYQQALLDNFPFGVWLKDRDNSFLAVNTPFAKNYEWSSADALVGKSDFDITSWENAQSRQKEDLSVRQSGKPQLIEKIVEIDGEKRCFEIFNSPISIDGKLPGTMGFARDVTDRHLANEELKESERRYRSFIENIPIGIAITQNGKIKYLNPKGAQLIGFTREECIDQEYLRFIHEADRPIINEARSRRLAGNTPLNDYELRIVDKQGRPHEFCVHASTVEWEGHVGTMAIFEEVRETQFAQAGLRRLATTDSFTELPSRLQFTERMAEALSRLRRDPDQVVALLLIGIDHLTIINDGFGPAASDAVLHLVSGLLNDKLRREDVAGRYGNDKFAILLPGSNLRSAGTFAERLREKITAAIVTIGDRSLAITASIGIAAIDPSDMTIHQALARADEALYRAKAGGYNRIETAAKFTEEADSERHHSA